MARHQRTANGCVGTVDVSMSAGEVDGTPWFHIEHFLKLRGFVRRQAGQDVVFVKCEHLSEFCSGLSELASRSRTSALKRFNKARCELFGGGGECDARSFLGLLTELGFSVAADGACWVELLGRVEKALEERRAGVVINLLPSEDEGGGVPEASEYSEAGEIAHHSLSQGCSCRLFSDPLMQGPRPFECASCSRRS